MNYTSNNAPADEVLNKKSEYALGRHMAVQFYDCEHSSLLDCDKVEQIFNNAAKYSGATVLGSNFHDFEPKGISGFGIIAKSHFFSSFMAGIQLCSR